MDRRAAIAFALLLALLAPAAHSTTARAPMTPGESVDDALAALARVSGVPDASARPLDCGPLASAFAALAADLGVAAPPAPALPAAKEDALARLVCALHHATLLRNAAYADVDARTLASDILSQTERPSVALSSRHVAANAAGARLIAGAVDDAIAAFTPQAPPAQAQALAPARAPAQPQLSFPPVLAMDLVGIDTLYADDVALILDVGGNDLYDNNAGGSLIALGGGNFIPVTGDPSSYGPSQCVTPTTPCTRVVVGGDFEDAELVFSAALVLDLAGDDTYGLPRAPWHDARCTSEPVVRKVAIQGAGAGGPGLLFDLAGDNVFRAKTIAQGTGHVGGVGVMYLGPGNDRLEAVRMAQGSGLFFGLGLLVNEGGDDVYVGRAPEGGVFNTDGSFCDAEPRYLHGSGFARVTGGASGFAGALLDRAGNDLYVGDTKGGGFGEVASVGIFVDEAGDDQYFAVKGSLGFASGHPSTSGGGLGVFIDAAGNDRYTLTTAAGLGATPGALVDPTQAPLPYAPYTFWVNEVVTTFVDPVLISGAAVFYDGGGTDVYDTPALRTNGEAKATTVGGLFVDAP